MSKSRKPVVVQSDEFKAAEAVLVANYAHLAIVPGSLRPGSDRLQGKRVVTVACPACSEPLVRATSDLWTLKSCPTCKAKGKKEKAKKKGKK